MYGTVVTLCCDTLLWHSAVTLCCYTLLLHSVVADTRKHWLKVIVVYDSHARLSGFQSGLCGTVLKVLIVVVVLTLLSRYASAVLCFQLVLICFWRLVMPVTPGSLLLLHGCNWCKFAATAYPFWCMVAAGTHLQLAISAAGALLKLTLFVGKWLHLC